MEHVSKSEVYLYAVLFHPNNKNFENGGERDPKIWGGSLKGGKIPRDYAPGRAKLLGISPGGRNPCDTGSLYNFLKSHVSVPTPPPLEMCHPIVDFQMYKTCEQN